MKTKRYDGKVGDDVAVLVRGLPPILRRGHVIGERGRGDASRVAVQESDVVRWYRRANGVAVSERGVAKSTGTERRLIGPWLAQYGDNHVHGAAEVEDALAAGSGANILDPRQRAVAEHVRDLCAIFGVEPMSLSERLAVDQHDPVALAHNGLRKFAVGAVVHLAHEIDVAWQGKGVSAPRQGLKAVAEVPQLAGVHRGTLANCHAQFAALCGLATTGGVVAAPKSELGRFVRDRYHAVRALAAESAAVAVAAVQDD